MNLGTGHKNPGGREEGGGETREVREEKSLKQHYSLTTLHAVFIARLAGH